MLQFMFVVSIFFFGKTLTSNDILFGVPSEMTSDGMLLDVSVPAKSFKCQR